MDQGNSVVSESWAKFNLKIPFILLLCLKTGGGMDRGILSKQYCLLAELFNDHLSNTRILITTAVDGTPPVGNAKLNGLF